MIMFNMEWPQITVLVLFALQLIAYAGMHGKPRTGNYHVFTGMFSVGLLFFLLYAGGFFA